MAEKRVTFTNDYNKRPGPSNGSVQFTYNNIGNRHQAGRDIPDTQQSTYDGATQFHPRNNWGNPPRNNTFNSGRGDRSIDIRISSFTEMMTMTIGTALPKPRREETDRTLGAIHVLLLVRDKDPQHNRKYQPSRSKTPNTLVFRRSKSQKTGGFGPYMNSGSLEPMTNLALTQSDLPLRTIQPMQYPTSAH